uniref:Uncharacterized protein n=1 Tax=Anguilla anguilla TaxID=7936 RepID=A0A0E9Q1Q3_ANGAN
MCSLNFHKFSIANANVVTLIKCTCCCLCSL